MSYPAKKVRSTPLTLEEWHVTFGADVPSRAKQMIEEVDHPGSHSWSFLGVVEYKVTGSPVHVRGNLQHPRKWVVDSQSSPNVRHTVSGWVDSFRKAHVQTCTCEDHIHRARDCKHMLFVQSTSETDWVGQTMAATHI